MLGMRDAAKRIADEILAKLKRGELDKVDADLICITIDRGWSTIPGHWAWDKDVFEDVVFRFVVYGAAL